MARQALTEQAITLREKDDIKGAEALESLMNDLFPPTELPQKPAPGQNI